ncbi:hypothetical protein DYB38_008796 [Aphanomyces astaci]|uniref:Uncharacterized protein n=1 Tax=Aphanomyces astaci TaxID=112090 RepID=A0A397DEL5_APHAT|nr:hypothetical protein DYB38_008796 [Aphanomyces astaci]
MGVLKSVAVSGVSLALALALTVPTGLTRYVLVTFGINWLVALVHAIPNQSERYFDLTGSSTFVTVAGVTAATTLSSASSQLSSSAYRSVLASAMVALWGLRLGWFLFSRINADNGIDSRFTELRSDPLRFLSLWSVQSLWVLITTLPLVLLHGASLATSSPAAAEWTLTDFVGLALWVFGFIIEITADAQKREFRRDKSNHDKFIATGLWRFSRHPNYFGEIMLWVGMAVLCVPHLATFAHKLLGCLSPLFVTFLLTRVSGIPLLEQSADDKWATHPAYQTYKATTNVLIPWFPKAAK